MYTYLFINAITISFPLLRSFENKIRFYKKWKYLFPAILITGVFFIIWDHFFTNAGIWGFSEEYIIGLYIFSLPIEEWLFFLTVPFACVFIYEVVKYFVKTDPLKDYSKIIISIIILFLLLAAAFNIDKLYTSVTFFLAAIGLLVHWFIFKTEIFGLFFITYLIHLIPFFIVNGILTSLPVVHYNDFENLSIRIFTIPVEDSVYSFLLLLMNISIYEFLMNKKKLRTI